MEMSRLMRSQRVNGEVYIHCCAISVRSVNFIFLFFFLLDPPMRITRRKSILDFDLGQMDAMVFAC